MGDPGVTHRLTVGIPGATAVPLNHGTLRVTDGRPIGDYGCPTGYPWVSHGRPRVDPWHDLSVGDPWMTHG